MALIYPEIIRISIHAPREGSDLTNSFLATCALAISIHAPREGSDPRAFFACRCSSMISIHAPREGSDDRDYDRQKTDFIFLSTLPVRGATPRSQY